MALLDLEILSGPLEAQLLNLPDEVLGAVADVIRDTTDRALQIVKFRTPVDSGKALNAWRRSTGEAGQRGTFTNDTDYINVLEFGGYPVRAARGRGPTAGGFQRGAALLGGLPPGPRTQAAPGGTPPMRSNVSKQSPRGMVRSTLEDIEPQFVFDMDEAIDRALNGG